MRIRIPPIAVTRHERIPDHVVTRQHICVEVAVVRDARIDDGYNDACALADIPRAWHAHTALRFKKIPLQRVKGVIGSRCGHWPHDKVQFRIFHVRIGAKRVKENVALICGQLPIGPENARSCRGRSHIL
ncbi:hypothetical protein ACHMXB_12190 [Arthrobacter sp. UC242_113]|uniref:hypothetical protein n=1 Tax=Arthrobacter sp. UC242_113 TaxID=3374550 RepID=UPI0037580787